MAPERRAGLVAGQPGTQMHTGGSGGGYVAILLETRVRPVERHRGVDHGLGRVLPGQQELDGLVGVPALVVQVDDQLPLAAVHLGVELERVAGRVVVVAEQVDGLGGVRGLAGGYLGDVLAEPEVEVTFAVVLVAGVADRGVVQDGAAVGRVEDRQLAVRQSQVGGAVDAGRERVHLAPRLARVAVVVAVEERVADEVAVELLLEALGLVAVARVHGDLLDGVGAVRQLTRLLVDRPGVCPVVRAELRHGLRGGGGDLLVGSGEVLSEQRSAHTERHKGDGNEQLDDTVPTPVSHGLILLCALDCTVCANLDNINYILSSK